MATTVTAALVRALEGSISRQGVANAAVSMGEAVYIADDSDNILPKVAKTDANVGATSVFHGIVTAISTPGATAAAAGDGVTVTVLGPVSGFAGMTPGARQFVSETAGEVTETAPSGAGTWTSSCGYAESAGVLFVLPGVGAPSSNS